MCTNFETDIRYFNQSPSLRNRPFNFYLIQPLQVVSQVLKRIQEKWKRTRYQNIPPLRFCIQSTKLKEINWYVLSLLHLWSIEDTINRSTEQHEEVQGSCSQRPIFFQGMPKRRQQRGQKGGAFARMERFRISQSQEASYSAPSKLQKNAQQEHIPDESHDIYSDTLHQLIKDLQEEICTKLNVTIWLWKQSNIPNQQVISLPSTEQLDRSRFCILARLWSLTSASISTTTLNDDNVNKN